MALQVRCRFFASYAEVLGRDSITFEMPHTSVVADAVERVRRDLPGGARLPQAPLVAVNREHVLHDRPLQDGDELAFLPPLAGG